MSLKLQQALETLYGLERRRDKLGLDGTRLLLGALGEPQTKFRSVHVAGTNGKGSVCAMIENALRTCGVRTGLYTSPHLVDFRERIRVGGRWAEDTALEERLEHLQTLPESQDRTFFEVATALAFDHFARAGVEWAVVETGLGGRLDSTNVLDPGVCVITRVSIDHAEILGADLATIAAEKAGIIKPGVPVVTGPQAPEVMDVLERTAAERGAPLRRADPRAPAAAPGALPGRHQRENRAIALEALRMLAPALPLDMQAAARAVAEARWPGRFESCPSTPRLWWDGAHNPAGFRALVDAWREQGLPAPVLVVALSRDKDPDEIARVLREGFGDVPAVATRTRNVRAMPADVLAPALERAGFETQQAPDVEQAVRAALDAGPDRPVLLAGSLFAVGEAMEVFGGAPGEFL